MAKPIVENKNKTNTLNKNILISDFQNTYKNKFTNVNSGLTLVSLQNSQQNNLSIDSISVNNNDTNNFTVNITVKNQGAAKENIPIAIYNDKKLISKQSFSIEKDTEKKVEFSIQKTAVFLGKIKITFSDTFNFDNISFFSINSNIKTNVLAIGKTSKYLSKIYTKEEFNFTQSSIKDINYNSLPKQQLIVLNQLKEIPQSLIASLSDYIKNGGYLIIIPDSKINIASYNLFLKNISAGKILSRKTNTLKITDINLLRKQNNQDNKISV